MDRPNSTYNLRPIGGRQVDLSNEDSATTPQLRTVVVRRKRGDLYREPLDEFTPQLRTVAIRPE